MMKKTITILTITALVLAIVTLALCLYVYGIKTKTPAASATPETQATTEAATEVSTEAPTEAVTEAPTEATTDVITEEMTEAPVEMDLEASVYHSENSSLEAEPGVTPDRITGRIFEGYPADVHATPMNWAVCRNLTMDGVDMDVPVNLLFKWEEIKQIKPGDGVQLYDKLILVEDVYGEEITGPGLIAINGGKYFFRHHPALYGGGTLGWGTTEEDCMFVYDLYLSAHTIVRDVHVDFNYPERFVFSVGMDDLERAEFVEKYGGKKFMATCSYGTAFGSIRVDIPDTDDLE